MKYVDEFRNPERAHRWVEAIQRITTRPWKIMEVCGGQTHSILKYGLDQLIPSSLELLHGPGCPVCVTPPEVLDGAIQLSKNPKVILCTYGDMMRVPGDCGEDLFTARARGADVRMVYSPMDALQMACLNPDREVVFLAVGFETTAPAHALAVQNAFAQNLGNFSLLVSHVLVPPAVEMILSSEKNSVHGFLAAGHVCTIMGYTEYEPLAQKYQVPFIVTGFEPVDLLEGIYLCVNQLEKGLAFVENQYSRSVRREGNLRAQESVGEVFEVSNWNWRGLGQIAMSGLKLREKYAGFDSRLRFGLYGSSFDPGRIESSEKKCLSGQILMGHIKPPECPHFGKACTPEFPMGPTMVSTEGACSAYFKYRKEFQTEGGL